MSVWGSSLLVYTKNWSGRQLTSVTFDFVAVIDAIGNADECTLADVLYIKSVHRDGLDLRREDS